MRRHYSIKMRYIQRCSLSLVYLFILAGIAIAACIDDPAVIEYYTELQRSDPSDPRLFHTSKDLAITLKECEDRCGSGMKRYPTLDIQSRFATWIVPLFLLIASIPFAPLGVGNIASVVINLLADPISSFESQASKFAYWEQHLKYCHSCLGQMPDNLKRAIAIIAVAHEESGPGADEKWGEKPTLLYIFGILLGEHSFPWDRTQQLHRIACLEAATQLSDIRSPTLSKAMFGLIIYLMSLSVGLIHMATDNITPHTDHSIAMAVMYSWLVPAILLGALIGGFGKKQSAGDILARLYQRCSIIEAKGCNEGSGKEALSPAYLPQEHQAFLSPLRTCSSQSGVGPDTVRWLRLLELETEHSDYSFLCWSGGNSTFRPRQSSWGKRRPWITAIAHLPVTCSVVCAFLISYTSPTRGVGCRSLLQSITGATWVINACITEMIRTHTRSAKKQWRYVRGKNAIIFLAQSTGFFAVFFGVFNSCFCWSAWFSLGSKANVLLDNSDEVKRLVKTTLPALTIIATVGQLILLGCIWYCGRRGARLFYLSDKERYKIPR